MDISKVRSISFTPVACITSDIFSVFLLRAFESKLEASEESQAQELTRPGERAPRSLRACLRSPEKREKNYACYAGYNSWAKIKYEIYNKKTAHRQEGKALSVKKQNVF